MFINGKKVKQYREASQKKVAKLAVEIDMSAPWVYALEKAKGLTDVKEPVVAAIAKALKVHKNDLVGVDGVEDAAQ